MPENLSTATVPTDMDGQRLDGALVLFLPEAGVRARKRLFDTHTILVNGIPRSKGHTVSAGDMILLVEKTEATAPEKQPEKQEEAEKPNVDALREQITIVHEDADFAAIYKPGGLHTAAITGKQTASLEDELPKLFSHLISDGAPCPVLVNRLDCLTSGMVIAAKTEEAAQKFRALENFGAVEKLYLLLVHGSVTAPLQVTNKLDMAKRKVTKVLPEDDADPLRHTTFLPLLETVVPDSPADTATLLMAAISKGARHQIRAHIASQGFPIVGDPLYGEDAESSSCDAEHTMYLHHYQIEIDTFSASCPPDWQNWEQLKSAIPSK